MSKNFVTLKFGSEVTQKWHYSVDSVWFPILLVFFSNVVPKMHRFWDIRLVSIVTLKPGLGSLKVIENYTIQSGTHDFLLTFYINHRPISHHFRDKQRFPSKIPVYLSPCWMGSPWNWVSVQQSEETWMMGLPDGRKSFKIGFAVLIQYRHVTDSQPASHIAVAYTALTTSSR